MRYGFRSVTMDEIATQSGVSKKTIYQFFNDKDKLVEEVMQAEMLHMTNHCKRTSCDSDNAVDELFNDLELIEITMEALNPQIIFDLEKFYPSTFKKFKHHKNTFMYDVIKCNLQRGIEQKLYRDDLNIDIIAKFRLESIFIMFNADLFPYGKYNLLKVAYEIFYHYVHGIVTPKGKEIFEKYLKERQKNKPVSA